MLKSWKSGEWFNKPGICFDVVENDGMKINGQKFIVTSRMLIRLLKPLILQAEKDQSEQLHICVSRIGDKQNTRYDVKTLSDAGKEKKQGRL